MEQAEFVVEGMMEIGPEDLPVIFVDGEGLASLLLECFPTPFDGYYHRLGYVRVTVERAEEDAVDS